MFKETRWAQRILMHQNRDGLWGHFHTSSEPSHHQPMTTEQALRRLSVLGYTIEDEPIKKAVDYMNDCLLRRRQMPDRREKTYDWDIFTDLMLATWVRRFTMGSEAANLIAQKWVTVITAAFSGGMYYYHDYIISFEEAFGMPPRSGRLVDFVTFYQLSIIAGKLDEDIEGIVVDYILQHKPGIYYVYDRPIENAALSTLPDCFESKIASRYIAAIEILADYSNSRSKLEFVINWLNSNKNENGKWDMGGSVKDNIYFPLSDSWYKKETREWDCTYRIEKLIVKLQG